MPAKRISLIVLTLLMLLLGLRLDAVREGFIPGEISLQGLPLRTLDLVTQDGQTHVLVLARFETHQPVRLAYLVSDDLGRHFSEPRFIETGAERLISNRMNPARLHVDGHHVVAVYGVEGPISGNGPLRVAVSEDGGVHWRTGIQPVQGDPQEVQSHPALVRDSLGVLHLAWLDDRDESGDSVGVRVARSRDGGLSWQAETTLDEYACTCCGLSMTGLDEKGVALLYRDHTPRDMRLALFEMGHSRWERLAAVGSYDWHLEGCPHVGGVLALVKDRDGAALEAIVWSGKEGQHGLHWLRSADQGRSWRNDLLLDDEGFDADLAHVDLGPSVMVYRHGIGSAARIMIRTRKMQTLPWSVAHELGVSANRAEAARVAADRAGYTVFWMEPDAFGEWRLHLEHCDWT